MNRTVEKGKTLLVDGPASVTLISGKAEVFAFIVSPARKIVIREGKRLPFTTEETSTFDVSSGESAVVEETEGNTIPASWSKAYEELLSLETKPAIALVIGTADSGKTSLCTYLINRLVREKRKVAILDGDLGQSDIGPPCTVSYIFVKRPQTDLFNLETRNAFFIGANSPKGVINRVIEGVSTLKKELLGENPDFVVINTDGWIEEEDAIYYKIKLIEELNPDVIFFIQQKNETASISNALEKFRKITVDSPPAIKEKSRENRRNLRELGYIKYLKNSKVQSLPLNWLKIEETEPLGLSKTHESARESRRIYQLLGMKPLHYAELSDRVSVIIGRRRWINEENIRKVEEFTKKKVVITRKGEEEGSLVALYGVDKRFRGVGVIQAVDYSRKILKIFTPVSGEISKVAIGKVRLDKNLKEISTFTEENQIDFPEFKKLS